MSLLEQARANIRRQLDWRGTSGQQSSFVHVLLTREQAEAILAGPTELVALGLTPPL